MRDLRISLTERCNFRCLYCLPETEEAANFYRSKLPDAHAAPFVFKLPDRPKAELLTFEEIERLARLFVASGIRKLRLTGGEPLLRKGIVGLVGALSKIPELEDLAMTSNGFLFPKLGADLARAGLRRVTFSLDSLDRNNSKRITGRDGLEAVLASIRLARELGLAPVKVNAVVIRGINDHEIEALAEFALREGFVMRFIEFMPLDSSRAWLKEMVVPGREILERLRAKFPLERIKGERAETARRWQVAGSEAEFGIIAPVTEPFCGHCNRLRLTADGKIRTCLFSLGEHDLRDLMRAGADEPALARRLRQIVGLKEERHHIGEAGFEQPERTMSCIGG